MSSGGAFTVTTPVAVLVGLEISASPGMARSSSSAVVPQRLNQRLTGNQ
jgi:hypothetical protein